MVRTTLLDALGRGGYRMTRPRREVAELIGARDGHFTAAELVAEAGRQRRRIGRATVFRALDTFTALGLVERLDLPSGEHAYVTCEPEPRHHHHLICATCGRTTEISGCNVAALAPDVERETGYQLDTHRVELFGTCPECQRRPRD
ncbi:MAG: Fur family transcriptional regulator [Candidatus Limnocylindria bacterium]